MIVKKIEFVSDHNILVGKLVCPEIKKKLPVVLFLHGAGKSTKENFLPWQKYLAERGYVSFAFDFRGVGKSSGNFIDGSLTNRLRDAHQALEKLLQFEMVDPKRIAVVGTSMGGFVAANLTKLYPLKAVVLWGAAAYMPKAENLPLNESFTHILRSSDDWSESSSIKNLKKYKGKVLIVYGEKDTVIPDEIKLLYKSITRPKYYKTLKSANHIILDLNNKECLMHRQKLFDITYNFLEMIR